MRGHWRMWVGVFFLLLGISIVLNVLFDINLPVFRIGFAVGAIYLGVRLLFGVWGDGNPFDPTTQVAVDATLFSKSHHALAGNNHEFRKFQVYFGSSTIDLTGAHPNPLKESRIYIDSAFAEVRVLLDPRTPVRIRANAVFGEAQLPDRNTVVFGSLNFEEPAAPGPGAADVRRITIAANVAFGSLKIRYQGAAE